MARLLLDTDVFSYRHKGDSRAKSYGPHVAGATLCVSFATVAELYRWAVAHRWGRRRIEDLRQDLRQHLILIYDDALAWHWAAVSSIPGHPIAARDAWVAATALRYDLTLVTHNARHFQHVPQLRAITKSTRNP